MKKKIVKKDVKTENTQHAAGMRCPECKGLGPFYIQGATCSFLLDDVKGCYNVDDVNWVDDDACCCGACDFSGDVSDFK
jgi:hypothetical protein